jgi:phosphoenolpyruvate-protein phosphotransferase (PTS system enzyme I)
MHKLKGVPGAPGIAMGPAHFLGGRVEVHERRILGHEVDAEIKRFEEALARADAHLERVQAQITAQSGDESQYGILEAHRLMLKDVHLVDETRRFIRDERLSAETAVWRALQQIQAVFSRIEDPYFRERRSDIDYVGELVLRNLVGVEPSGFEDVPRGAVVFAHDISPADMTQLGRTGVGGFFMEAGGKTSHSTVLARALGLPLVVGVQEFAHHVRPGMNVIVDGTHGEVILDPDEEARQLYAKRVARERQRAEFLAGGRLSPAETLDGVRIHLAANLELVEELPVALEMGAQSVGLFRTEFLYLDRPELPTEEEHYKHAAAVLRAAGGRVITFRTMDLGGDKLPPSVRIPASSNPAMGLRSIRYSLWRKDIFKAQLRALYRAATVAPMRILFPMISGVGELRAAKAACVEVCQELAREGIAHNPFVPLGTMVETPSAALIADLLAYECEFLTIGTNDLIQYSLAADRQDEHVNYLYHPLHPAILRSLRQIVLAAQRTGKPLAMCGDMAGDPWLSLVLIGLGLRDLSMSPRQIPVVKSIIRSTRVSEAERLVEGVLHLRTETEVEDMVDEVMRKRFPLELAD